MNVPRFSVKQFLNDIGITATKMDINEKPRIAYIDFKGAAGCIVLIVSITVALTLLLLFISSLGGAPFNQTWLNIPELALLMIIGAVIIFIKNRKKNT